MSATYYYPQVGAQRLSAKRDGSTRRSRKPHWQCFCVRDDTIVVSSKSTIMPLAETDDLHRSSRHTTCMYFFCSTHSSCKKITGFWTSLPGDILFSHTSRRFMIVVRRVPSMQPCQTRIRRFPSSRAQRGKRSRESYSRTSDSRSILRLPPTPTQPHHRHHHHH